MSEEDLAVTVDELLDVLIGSGGEIGLKVAVIRDGRTLVDAARGVADIRTGGFVDLNVLGLDFRARFVGQPHAGRPPLAAKRSG